MERGRQKKAFRYQQTKDSWMKVKLECFVSCKSHTYDKIIFMNGFEKL